MGSELQSLRRQLADRLEGYYPREQAEALARTLIEEAGGKPYPRLVLEEYKITEKSLFLIDEQAERLLRHEPLQQILGYEEFGGLRLKVTRDTLIPRPETEELCGIIQERGLVPPGGRLLDIGTGSGAIALFLKSQNPSARVTAIDLSPEALRVAEENGRGLGLEVDFRQMDLFRYKRMGPFDLVVSNPPYILPSEKPRMKPHVLVYEPPEALFVPEEDPLIYYRAILEKVSPDLKRGGFFAFEVNPLTIDPLADMYRGEGFDVRALRDFSGRDRFLFARKKR